MSIPKLNLVYHTALLRVGLAVAIRYILARIPARGAVRMALVHTISLGMSLPHRSPDPIEETTVRQVAQRAEALGFRDLWVTDNTLDHAGRLNLDGDDLCRGADDNHPNWRFGFGAAGARTRFRSPIRSPRWTSSVAAGSPLASGSGAVTTTHRFKFHSLAEFAASPNRSS